jgi:hypothetical protein
MRISLPLCGPVLARPAKPAEKKTGPKAGSSIGA